MLKKFTFLNDFFPTKKYTSHALKLYSEMFIFPNNTPFLPLKKNVILKAIQAWRLQSQRECFCLEWFQFVWNKWMYLPSRLLQDFPRLMILARKNIATGLHCRKIRIIDLDKLIEALILKHSLPNFLSHETFCLGSSTVIHDLGERGKRCEQCRYYY